MAIEKSIPLIEEQEELEIEVPDNSPVVPDGIEIEGLEETVLEIIPDERSSFYENLSEVIDERDLRNIALDLIGEFEEDATVDQDDISKNMAKLAGIDDSLTKENSWLMMLYDLDSHGVGRFTRITVKANGADESTKTCTFYLVPHF